MSTFDSTKRLLPEILAEIVKAKIQLPDFQRGWVWDDQHIRSLLVSIARSFPVGAVMLLETGGEAKFQVRPVEGIAQLPDSSDAELLILDGQQRLTTLTQVLATKDAVKTRTEKGKPIRRHYYWNIEVALEGGDHLEDAIEAIEEDKIKRSNFGRQIDLDLTTTQKECEQLYFPCDQILNSDAWEEALQEYAPEKFGLYMQFRRQVLNAFRNYQLPVIQLGKATTKEAVCLVFEKVNTGGVPLNVFELVTATYAADGFNLRDDWHGNAARNVSGRYQRLCKEALLSQVESTDFLQAVSMLHTLELRRADVASGKTGKSVQPVSAKRVSILAMPLSAYAKWADEVEAGFLLAAKFLRKECVKTPRELPYRTQLAPLASVLAHLAAAGIHLPSDPSLIDVTTAITEALDRRVEGNRERSDLGGLANRAIVGAVNDVLSPKLHSLFASDPDTMRAALADLGRPKEFGEFSRRFFARLANEGLQYFLSKVVNTQLGDGMRFATMNQSAVFNAALETHTREASVIVEQFSSEWFSKHRFEEGGDISRKSSDGFASYALTKMKDELKAGARSDAR